MSNKRMSWDRFLTEFVLRAMARPDVENYNFPARYAADLAREAWDAIQAAQLPQSEKVALAKSALSTYKDGRYIAQDDSGYWVVFKNKPVLRQSDTDWRSENPSEISYVFKSSSPPLDFTKQCYRIADILGTE